MKKGYIDDELYNYLRAILESIWSDIIPKEINCEDYISMLRLDKKSIGQDLRLILTKGIGRMFIEKVKIDDDFSPSSNFFWALGELAQNGGTPDEALNIKHIIPSAGFCERTEIFTGKRPNESGFFLAPLPKLTRFDA